MMNGFVLGVIALLYLAVLFGTAWLADRRPSHGERPAWRGTAYALSIAVLSSSWTYFGSVGVAARGDWVFAANMIGPILAITLLGPVWRRIGRLTKQENIGSIADFLSARYGKSRALGSIVALVAIVAALPYIALQFRSLANAWSFATGSARPPAAAAVAIAVILGVLAILFGTRRASLTQLSRGLVRMVALESVVKLSALVSVAVLSMLALYRLPDAAATVAALPPPSLDLGFATATLLCMGTALTLPRQFHVSFVTLESVADIAAGRRLYPLYMLAWLAAIVPIAMLARAVPIGGQGDLTILSVALREGGGAFMTLAFLGGFSAGTAMVIVETTALSAMISNEIVLPLLARTRWFVRSADAGRTIVATRRCMIVLILALALAYYRRIPERGDLSTLGFTALAASMQLLPALVGGVLWRRADRRGAIGGILAGVAIWFYTTGGPLLTVGNDGAGEGPIGVFAGPGIAFDRGVLASLLVNLAMFVGLSFLSKPRLIDRIQASAFVPGGEPMLTGDLSLAATVGDLRALLATFIGEEEAGSAVADLARSHRPPLDAAAIVTPGFVRGAERLLAGAIGASSARNVIALYLAGETHSGLELRTLLDEAAQAVQFSRGLLQRTLDSLDQSVCVVDEGQRLVAWNTVFAQAIGGPLRVAEPLVGRTAWEGDAGSYDAALVRNLVETARSRVATTVERESAGGCTFRIVGTPLPGDEYLLSISDTTEAHAAAQALRRMNEELEIRVGERTRELTELNIALGLAGEKAEAATRSQRRFVAAASHDLLQPLHAARLFLGAALEDLAAAGPVRDTVAAADSSINAADRLLHALLNLSRIEVGGLQPTMRNVDIHPLLTALFREFEPLAAARGLKLRLVATDRWTRSDPDLLRSVMQNLIGNAIRYTASGSVLIGVRGDRRGLRIEVRDSGPGLADEAMAVIFDDFTRLAPAVPGDAGAGLGLAIAERICHALGHMLEVRSAVGRGSTFSVALAAADPTEDLPMTASEPGACRPLKILCVDNEPEALDAVRLLLERLGHQVDGVATAHGAMELPGPWDVALVDYDLGSGANGLDVLVACRGRFVNGALVTASREPAAAEGAAAIGVTLLRKPVSPGALRLFLDEAAQSF